jgi:hypothetical protein
MKLRLVSNLRLLALVAAFPVLAADGLNVKTGTWETSITTKTSGMSMAMPGGGDGYQQEPAQAARRRWKP